MVITYILCLIFIVFACVMLFIGVQAIFRKLYSERVWKKLSLFLGMFCGLLAGIGMNLPEMPVYYDTRSARHKFVFQYLGVSLDSDVVETPVSEKYRNLLGPFPEPSWKHVRDWPHSLVFREEIRKYVVDEYARENLLSLLNEEKLPDEKKKKILKNYLDIFAGEGDWDEKERRAGDYLDEVRDELDNR